MAGINVKNFESADEVRTPGQVGDRRRRSRGREGGPSHGPAGMEVVECIKPVVGTDSCEAHHVGVIVAGTLHVVHNDGTEGDAGPGDAYVIEPGHDAGRRGRSRGGIRVRQLHRRDLRASS